MSSSGSGVEGKNVLVSPSYELFSQYRNEQYKRQLSNSENFDKAILTLSTAALGFSVGFVKDVVRLSQADYLGVLKLSWLFFALAIVTTIVSYFAAQLATARGIEIARKYFLQGQSEAVDDENRPAVLVDRMNIASGLLFILGIVTTTWFIAVNVG
jgi:hypothetical protein